MRHRLGFASDKVDVSLFLQFVSHEWEAESTVIGSAADVADHHIWCDVQEFKLLLDFKSYHSLVHQDMIQHGAEAVSSSLVGESLFECLADCYPQRAGILGIFLKQTPSKFCVATGR